MTVVLQGSGLTVADVVRVAREGEPVELSAESVERMRETRALVERVVSRGDEVYGVTTGVGARKKIRVPLEEIPAFNRRLIENHRVGTGPDAPPEVVRATMVRHANALAKGTSGVRPEIAKRIVRALNDGERPRVRMLGSLGQGDLAPMADLAAEPSETSSSWPKRASPSSIRTRSRRRSRLSQSQIRSGSSTPST